MSWQRWADVGVAEEFPVIDHAARRTRLQGELGGLGEGGDAAALLVSGASNLRWASGFTGSHGALLLTPAAAWLLTDARYVGRAAVECPGLEVRVTRTPADTALELAVELGLDRLAFEGDHLTHSQAVALQSAASDLDLAGVVSVQDVVEPHRSVKDDAELARLARACALTEVVLDGLLADGLVDSTERGVARAVEDGFRAHGYAPAFATIVASGPNGAVPHHDPTDRVIAAGDLVTIDCGALVAGYHADTTRTVAAGELPRGEAALLCEVFDLVAAAQELGVAAATLGAATRDVDAAAREHIEAGGHGDAFVHGTGHGVGLDIHEAPAVSATASATLRDRTALTVEPGIYLPGRGGVRIEDTVVVTTDGPVRLTHSPHDLLVV